MRNKHYYVYLATNYKNTVIYTGFTSNLINRIWQHKNKFVNSFTSKYKVNRLLHFEEFDDPENAIKREKQIKGWLRKKKIKLIKKGNPNFDDLYEIITK